MSKLDDFSDIGEDLVDVIVGLPTWAYIGIALFIIGIIVICLV